MTFRAKCLALALAVLVAPAHAQPHGAFDAWTPDGWKRIATATGDLNRDGVDDAALVLEQTDPDNIRPNDGLGAPVLNLNPRRLLILFKTPDGYRKILSRDALIPSTNDQDNPCLDDPLLGQGDLSVAQGQLEITLGYWLSCGSWGVMHKTFDFALENNRFRLTGYDFSTFARNTGIASALSIDYLTGKKKTTTGDNMFEPSRPEISWSSISGPDRFYLDKIDFDRCGESGCTPTRPNR